MAQAKMYQVDHLKQNIYNVFNESISVLEQQQRIEKQEFIQEKRKFIANNGSEGLAAAFLSRGGLIDD